jgi:hypothetical protein
MQSLWILIGRVIAKDDHINRENYNSYLSRTFQKEEEKRSQLLNVLTDMS